MHLTQVEVQSSMGVGSKTDSLQCWYNANQLCKSSILSKNVYIRSNVNMTATLLSVYKCTLIELTLAYYYNDLNGNVWVHCVIIIYSQFNLNWEPEPWSLNSITFHVNNNKRHKTWNHPNQEFGSIHAHCSFPQWCKNKVTEWRLPQTCTDSLFTQSSLLFW